MSHKFHIEPYVTADGRHVVRIDHGTNILFSRWVDTISKEEAFELAKRLHAAATTDFSEDLDEVADQHCGG